MISDTEIQFPNVNVNYITIVKYSDRGNSKNYTLWSSDFDDPNAYSTFNEIVIEEDMFGGPITGYVSIYDSSYLIEQLNLNFFDSIIISINNKIYSFRVFDLETQSDFASKQIHGPAGNAKIINIRFTSDEFLYRNFDIQPLVNFIGKISKNEGNNSAGNQETNQAEAQSTEGVTAESSSIGLVTGIPSDLVTLEDENAMKGFVQTLLNTMSSRWSNKPIISDDTFNDIWIKPNPTFYPFSKLSNSSRLHQLMNYVCEYACWKEDPRRVDFFFWEDLDNWNFKSVKSLAKESKKGIYVPSEFTERENCIISMEIISELSLLQLLSNGCIFSEYIRVVPNWGDPYRNILDSGSSLIKKQIVYDYDFRKDIAIKPAYYSLFEFDFSLVPQDILNRIKYGQGEFQVPYNTNRLLDNNYGYYSSPYNLEKTPWWNFYNHMADGFTGDQQLLNFRRKNVTEEELLNLKPEFGEMSRLENEYWQAQFDFCELPGALLRKIYKEIKWPTAKARTKYAKLKQIKNKWNSFRKNICCEREVPLNFFAILMDAEKIYGATASESLERDSGGIYAYDWAEVEFWPKSSLPDLNVFDSSKKIIEFEDANFPFVFVMPSYGLIGKKSKEYNIDDRFSKIAGLSGITATTFYTPDNRAYNLNEILNSVAPFDFEDQTEYQTLLMNPGITDVLGTVDSEQRANITSYPTETTMMPVGKFRIISENCPDFSQSGSNIPASSAETNSGGFYFGGRIVQMNAIPKDILDTFSSLTPGPFLERSKSSAKLDASLGVTFNNNVTSYTFVFDVVNAHDGLCNSDNCA